MPYLVTWSNQKQRHYHVHNIFSIVSLRGIFRTQGQVTPKLIVRSGWNLKLFEIICLSCKFEEDPIKNEGAVMSITCSPLYVYGRFWLWWKPKFSPDLPQNLMQLFLPHSDASDKIWSRLDIWPQKYLGLKVWMKDPCYTISSPCEPLAPVS